jgi:glucokinase
MGVTTQDKSVIGVDIGGTSISAGLVTNGKLEKICSNETGAQRPAEEILDTLFTTIQEVWTDEVVAIGIGTPGLLDLDSGTILNIKNIPAWKGMPLKRHLENRFKVPAFVNNDANCFALGEKHFGKAMGMKNVVGITLGTGLGAGVIVNDKLHCGLAGGAGEFGSISYQESNMEAYCSSEFFNRKHNTTGIEAFSKAMTNDANALHIFDEFGFHMAQLVKIVLLTLAPDAIIFGGSIGKSFPLFIAPLHESLKDFPLQEVSKKVMIDYSELEHSAIFGAAALYYDSLH